MILKDARIRFPFGFQTRLVTSASTAGAVQRPFGSDAPNAPSETDEARFAQAAATMGAQPQPPSA